MITLFGTDGIRGRVGAGWFVTEKLSLLGQALGQWAQLRYGKNPCILIVHDTRESCLWIKQILIDELVRHGSNVYDASLLPTPAAWHIMQHMPFLDCALVISASHNPYNDNGIKIIDRKTGKIHAQDEATIEQFTAKTDPLIYTGGTTTVLHDAEDIYINAIISTFKPQFLQGRTIVLDVANGATYRVAERLFSALQARVILIHDNPNGKNINEQCGSMHPQNLQARVLAEKADIGFAFDGDGDRLIAVNRHGEIKDGDDLLALLIHHPAYSITQTVVGTVMTNKGFERYLESHQKMLQRTFVGDKYVAEQLMRENLLLGGEPSGHIIMRDLIGTGDGILAALRVIEAMMHKNNWNMQTFTKYPQIIINVPYTQKKNLDTAPLQNLIHDAHKQLDHGRLIVRFSGTENYLRVMIEAPTQEQASSVGLTLAHALEKELNS